MSESEIDPLISLILRRGQILPPLLQSPTIPYPLPALILPNIIQLRQSIQGQVHKCNANQNFIPASIVRFIIIPVDVGGNNIRDLNSHIIKRRCNGAGAYRVCITGLQGNLDSVDIWICCDEGQEDVADPGRCVVGNSFESDEERDCPDLC